MHKFESRGARRGAGLPMVMAMGLMLGALALPAPASALLLHVSNGAVLAGATTGVDIGGYSIQDWPLATAFNVEMVTSTQLHFTDFFLPDVNLGGGDGFFKFRNIDNGAMATTGGNLFDFNATLTGMNITTDMFTIQIQQRTVADDLVGFTNVLMQLTTGTMNPPDCRGSSFSNNGAPLSNTLPPGGSLGLLGAACIEDGGFLAGNNTFLIVRLPSAIPEPPASALLALALAALLFFQRSRTGSA